MIFCRRNSSNIFFLPVFAPAGVGTSFPPDPFGSGGGGRLGSSGSASWSTPLSGGPVSSHGGGQPHLDEVRTRSPSSESNMVRLRRQILVEPDFASRCFRLIKDLTVCYDFVGETSPRNFTFRLNQAGMPHQSL